MNPGPPSQRQLSLRSPSAGSAGGRLRFAKSGPLPFLLSCGIHVGSLLALQFLPLPPWQSGDLRGMESEAADAREDFRQLANQEPPETRILITQLRAAVPVDPTAALPRSAPISLPRVILPSATRAMPTVIIAHRNPPSPPPQPVAELSVAKEAPRAPVAKAKPPARQGVKGTTSAKRPPTDARGPATATARSTPGDRRAAYSAQAKLHYPSASKRAGHEGTVKVRIYVNAIGQATGAEVAKSSGHRSLDEAALRCARDSRYLPAIKNGQPVDSWTEASFRFSCEG